MTFVRGGVVDRRVAEHPAVLGGIGFDLVSDAGGGERGLETRFHVVRE